MDLTVYKGSNDESSSDREVVDGFEEIFTFTGHKLSIRGFNVVTFADDLLHDARDSDDEDNQKDSVFIPKRRNYLEQYISWDAKHLLLWQRSLSESTPRIIRVHKFSQANFICSVASVTNMKLKMQVFLAAALDMSFKIYDRNLTMIESIKHEERAILQLVCDHGKDIILSSGAAGISVWRLYKNSSIDTSHIMEKLFTLDNCSYWVSKMIYEPAFDRIYVMKERSVIVYNLSRQSIQAEIMNAHQAPVTTACWYSRNQFYLTGCRYTA